MSANNLIDRCASCGVKESDGDAVKLKKCGACHLVQYCSVKCQKEHRPKHRDECKIRADELRDEILFRQPRGSCFDDCPICFLPLSHDESKSTAMICCGKLICNGCSYTNLKQQIEAKLQPKCPFCRKPSAGSQTEALEVLKERAETECPLAMYGKGNEIYNRHDYSGALSYMSKAAMLGHMGAKFTLGVMYEMGNGVEKNKSKALHFYEEVAIGGHPRARTKLGYFEWNDGRYERAIKHWTISAKLGYDDALELIKTCYRDGYVSKDEFAAALGDTKLSWMR